MQTEQERIPPPPGLIASLASGFDAVATHILVIALPLGLDLFLWLGPHLRILQLAESMVNQLQALSGVPLSQLINPVDAAGQQNWTNYLSRFNLFNLLQTIPVGVTGLMGGVQMPTSNPYGNAINVEAGSMFEAMGAWILLVLGGWLLGALYFHWVSSVSLKLGHRSLLQSIKQTIFLSIIWVILFMVFGVPALMIFGVFLAINNQVLAAITPSVFGVIVIWLVMPIFFSPHGIFTFQQDAFHSILNSLRLVRFTLPTTALFLLAYLLIGQGMDFLWHTPPENSWLALVGIAGHAFIATGLLAASFIYYRDINAWLQSIFQMLKSQPTSVKV